VVSTVLRTAAEDDALCRGRCRDGPQVVGQEFRHDDGTDDELSLGHKYFSPSEFPTRLPRFSNDSEAAGVFTLSLEKPYFALDME